jgi:hypothetical protein
MSTFNLSLDPAQVEFVIKPGITITQAYNVINNSEETLYLNTQVLPWEPVGIEGDVGYQNVPANPNISFSLFNADIKLGQPFVLPPGVKQQIVLKITTSPQAVLNDYYYTFFVSQNQTGIFGNNSSHAQAYGQIGSHILLTVSDNENPNVSAAIKNFTVSPRIKDIFFTPLTFKAEIKNNSDFFFKTQGKLTITKNDLKVAETDLNNDNVLAHHSRSLNCQDQNFCVLNPPFWPGHYTATLTLDQSIGGSSSSISFFVFPFSLVAFLTLAFMIFLSLQKFFKLIFQKNKKTSTK